MTSLYCSAFFVYIKTSTMDRMDIRTSAYFQQNSSTKMFRFVVLAVCVAVAVGQGYGPVRGHRQGGYADDYSEPTPYKFGFDLKDDYNNQISRQESGDGYGNVQGSYGYQDANGIYRQVEYTADDYGFKAQIKTNEPGTDNQNPADVSIYADPIQVKYDAPKRGYQQSVGHSGSYQAPSYGQRAAHGASRRGYGQARSHSAGYGNTRSYSAPSYGQRSYGVPSYGQGNSRSYAAPSYSYGRTTSYKANNKAY